MIAYETILDAKRSDKLWVGVPKYTSKREIGGRPDFNWPSNYDDRAILTSILKSGEYTIPVKYEQPENDWHLRLPHKDNELERLLDNILAAITRSISSTTNLMHSLLFYALSPISNYAMNINYITVESDQFQCSTAGIMEPYPLYMADRMVKSLAKLFLHSGRQRPEEWRSHLKMMFRKYFSTCTAIELKTGDNL
jgi:hypothetical protein